MKLKPASKFVSLKSNRFVVVVVAPDAVTVVVLEVADTWSEENPLWLNEKFGPPPTYGIHRVCLV